MDPVTLVIVPGFVGGLAIAILVIRLNRKSKTAIASDVFGSGPLSTDVINMARIRVAGVGGLGLVAMALLVAVYVPRIGQSLAIGLALGALFALILIVRRRRAGPMPSSGRRAGANTTLSIDVPASSADGHRQDSSDMQRHDLVAVSSPSSPLAEC